MKKQGKRFLVLAAMICSLGLFSMGCGIQGNEVVATLDGENVTLDIINLYARINQAAIETNYGAMFGDDMWSMDLYGNGSTYELMVKSELLQEMQIKLLAEKRAEEYDVSLTEEDYARINEVAEAFLAANDEAALKKMSANKKSVTRLLELMTIDTKVYAAIMDGLEVTVTDEEVAQTTIAFVSMSIDKKTDDAGVQVDLTDEEKAEVRQKAEDILAKAKETGDFEATVEEIDSSLTVQKANYGVDNTSILQSLKDAVVGLSDGAFGNIVETETAIYVVQLFAEYDEEATASVKENLIAQRKNEQYSEIINSWLEASDFEVNARRFSRIQFASTPFRTKVVETEALGVEVEVGEPTTVTEDDETEESESEVVPVG
jgi:PPIC-type PPIASE domain.